MSSRDPLVGRQLGDYTIQILLGRGGMSRVYRGYDENLQRYAAVKVISGDFVTTTEEEYTRRFQSEARAIAHLRHPNIVGIYQFGRSEGIYYMAQVFLEGKDLRELLKDYADRGERLPVAEVIRIVRDVANALDYAHEQGVIHRDIKPSNIMLERRTGRAILMDFGLALSVHEGTTGDTFGSAHYIAPEQAISSAKAVPQSDLYSLGIVLYEMLAGKVPFDDPSVMSVALKHLNDVPPPPTMFNPDLPSPVEAVILRALAKQPKDRFPTSVAMVDELERGFGALVLDDSKPSTPLTEMIDAPRSRKTPAVAHDFSSYPGSEPRRPDTSESEPGPGLAGRFARRKVAKEKEAAVRAAEAGELVIDDDTLSSILDSYADPAEIGLVGPDAKGITVPDASQATPPDAVVKLKKRRSRVGVLLTLVLVAVVAAGAVLVGPGLLNGDDTGETPTDAIGAEDQTSTAIAQAVGVGDETPTDTTPNASESSPTPATTEPDDTPEDTPAASSSTPEDTSTPETPTATERPTQVTPSPRATEAVAIVPSDTPGSEPPSATPTTPAPTEVPTDIPTDVPTEVPTELPTDSPTDTPPTTAAAVEPSPTDTTVEPTPTPAETSAPPSTPPPAANVGLVYDDAEFLLFNMSDETLDISDMRFVQVLESGSSRTLASSIWQQGTTGPLNDFAPGHCYRIYYSNATLNNLADPDCDRRLRYYETALPVNLFWVSSRAGAAFSVFQGEDETPLATCTIADGRCEFYLPPPPPGAVTGPGGGPALTLVPTPEQAQEPNITLRYDPDEFFLINTADEDLNVSTLIFEQTLDDGRALVFRASRWDDRPDIKEPTWAMGGRGGCYQLTTTDGQYLEFSTPRCPRLLVSYQTGVTSRYFWISDDPGALFTVRRLDDDTLYVTCQIALGECSFYLSPP